MEQKSSKYKYRLLARFIIEAETPIAIGIGEKDILTDSLAAIDVNGLPYIPGTTIAGVVRSMVGAEDKNLFGFQESKKGHGSEVTFSEGKILDSNGTVVDGLVAINDSLLDKYCELPIRQHVRIDGRGTAEKAGKFDEQVVFAGTRFCFEVEIVSDKKDDTKLKKIFDAVNNKIFRLGSGSHSGFGQIRVVRAATVALNLQNHDDLNLYLKKSSNLQESGKWEGWLDTAITNNDDIVTEGWTTYALILKPDDFFLFGSGHGDGSGDADVTAVRAAKVDWSTGKGELKENCILIPATSLKGALRHRVAYHYNKNLGHFVENGEAQEAKDCKIIQDLFGSAGDNEQDDIRPGKILFHDIIKNNAKVITKLVNHVSIDRFTGGAIDGALFTEQVDYGKGEEFTTTLMVPTKALEGGYYQESFEQALKDIVNGMLPLGGGVNRGNGIFTGIVTKDGKELK